MKVLFLNCCYFTKLSGSKKDYLLKGHRLIKTSKRVKDKFRSDFGKILTKHKPDLIFLAEIKQEDIVDLTKQYKYFIVENKYGKTGGRSGAILSKSKVKLNKFLMSAGIKKLVLTAERGNKKFAVVHLSLSRNMRKKQLEELLEKFRDHIIVGDLNNFGGMPELELFKKTHNIADLGPTFPSSKPKKHLDHFIIPKKYKFKYQKIETLISDHLPIILNIK
ncbi:MAG: hypothetical protein CXT77_04320 [uncultured DHVE6 group euryarchaeote]|nr:MAG: hypothetical protein CXT77_04320 [uncultured DHVE6 group euryarchaeote]